MEVFDREGRITTSSKLGGSVIKGSRTYVLTAGLERYHFDTQKGAIEAAEAYDKDLGADQ